MVRKSLLILLLSISLKSFSQQSINNAIEYLQRFSTEELDWENISISLQDFKEHPLRLNHLNTARFIEFPLLNQRHLASIRKYIKSNGQLYSINELTNLAYFTPDLVNVIKPFISFSIKNKPSKVRASILQKVNLQLEPNYGLLRNDSDRFTGAKSQSLSRLIIQNKTQKVGFIWEKDKGESIQNSFIKYGYQGRFTKLRYQINLGSYSLHLGEGLLHSNKFIVGKSAPISSFYKITQPLSINTSSTEDNYETGLAISSKLKSVKLMAFYSRNRLHGTYEDGTILSIKKDGLFRNQSEINKRNTGAYNLAGTSISLQTKLLILSLNSIYVYLNRPYIPAPSYYNSNYQISNCFNNSLHYRYFDGSKSIKGEVAIDKMGNLATTHFFVFPVNDDFNFLLNMRSFSKKYSSFRANTLSENSRVQNEHAVLTGFDFIGSKTKMYASMDYFAFPAPKYLVHLPSNGTEFLGYISRQLTDSIDLKLFYKYESKHQDLNTEVIDLPLKRSLHCYLPIFYISFWQKR